VFLKLREAQPGVSDDLVEAFHVGLLIQDREVLETIRRTQPVCAAELAVKGRLLSHPIKKASQPALLQLLKLGAGPALMFD
jgi:hypothetical protein